LKKHGITYEFKLHTYLFKVPLISKTGGTEKATEKSIGSLVWNEAWSTKSGAECYGPTLNSQGTDWTIVSKLNKSTTPKAERKQGENVEKVET